MSVQAPAIAVEARNRPMTAEERKVILASSLGTVFEWYDFYLYGSLAAIIGAQFFSAFDVTTRNVFALLALMGGGLVWLRLEDAIPPNAHYVPARMQDGRIVAPVAVLPGAVPPGPATSNGAPK